MVKFNRRNFLQLGVAGIVLSFTFFLDKLSLSQKKYLKHKTRILPFNKNKTVDFFKDYIVINKKQKTIVLTAHCTHLGCTINKVQNGRLVCPCHGSEYDLDGNALKGPAYQPLKKIAAEISSDGKHLQIED